MKFDNCLSMLDITDQDTSKFGDKPIVDAASVLDVANCGDATIATCCDENHHPQIDD